MRQQGGLEEAAEGGCELRSAGKEYGRDSILSAGGAVPGRAGTVVTMKKSGKQKIWDAADGLAALMTSKTPLDAAADEQDAPEHYPANLTVGNIYYFLAVPTLCYQVRSLSLFLLSVRFKLTQCATS